MTSELPADLVAATARFCRLLRARGVTVTLGGGRDALRALELVDLGDRAEVRCALRAVLASGPAELAAFDEVFDAFLGSPREPVASGDETRRGVPPAPLLPPRPGGRAPILEFAGWKKSDGSEGEPVALPRASDAASAGRKDFSSFGADELEEVARVAERLARRLAARRSRRLVASRREGRVDLRRTLRASLTLGEPIELARRRRKVQKTKLVVLCDVSGSMDLYSRLLLQFLYAMQNRLGRMETFVFSTRLCRISDELRVGSYGAALARLGGTAGWSGGTRIGESLREFLTEWGRLVDRETVVLVLSDGWDTGDPATLGETLALLRRNAAKLVWLNPLLGSPGYEPRARGMAAALPHLDAFLPANNLESLEALVRHLRP